jgi:hypothetical protein
MGVYKTVLKVYGKRDADIKESYYQYLYFLTRSLDFKLILSYTRVFIKTYCACYTLL